MLAFEAQLSTTFLSVVVERRLFYRDEGALLVWVFGSFDPGYRRLMTDDVLFPNNSNLFVVDDETTTISESSGVFHIRCHHRVPLRDGGFLADEWRNEIVPFATVTQDRAKQRASAADRGQELTEISSDGTEGRDREYSRRASKHEGLNAFYRAALSRGPDYPFCPIESS